MAVRDRWLERIAQPQGAARVNQDHPFAADLAFLINGAAPGENLATGRPVTAYNGATLKPGVGGLGLNWSSAASAGLQVDSEPLLIGSAGNYSTGATMAILADPIASTNRSLPLCLSDNATQPQAYIGINAAAGTLTASSGTVSANIQTGSVALSGAVDGTLKLYLITRFSAGGNEWIRLRAGRDHVVGSGASNFSQASNRIYVGGYSSGSWAATEYVVYLAVGFNRALELDEEQYLVDEPWKLFEPERIWVPVSAGGGGSTTVTVDSASIALSGQSVTASTSVPVTASALSLTGSSVPLTQTITVDSSAITLTGQSVTNTTTIPVTAGSVTLTGSEISVTVGGDTTVTVDSGTLSLTGQTVTNTVSVPVSAASITLSGQTITGTTIIPVTAGTVSLTGGDITITYSGPSTTTVSVDPASLILVGQSIDVSYSGRTGGGAAKAKLKKKKRKFQTQTPDETLEALVEQLKEDKKPVLKQVKEIVEEVKELIEESSEDNDKEESEEKHETLETTTVMFFVASLINKTNEAVETMQRFETKLGRLEASLKKIEQSARNAEELALLLYSER